MKKIVSIVFLAIITGVIYISTACKNPPIFASIEKEVSLKKASVSGPVQGLVRINNMLYVTNGILFSKKFSSTGSWTEVPVTGTSGSCTSIATDGTSLYAVFGETAYRQKNAEGSWEEIQVSDDSVKIQFITGTKNIIAQGKKGKAFVTFKIENTQATKISSLPDAEVLIGAAGIYFVTSKGVYKDTSKVMHCPEKGIQALCTGQNDSSIFIVAEKKLHHYNGTKWTSCAVNIKNPSSITYLEEKAKVLVGGTPGFEEITNVKDGLDNPKKISLEESDSVVSRKYYHQYKNSAGKWAVSFIKAYDSNSEYILYAGVMDPNTRYTGLWGFYSKQQHEWNRE